MIVNFTDSEALAISQKLQERSTGVLEPILGGESSIDGSRVELDIASLESAIEKLETAMKRSDAKVSRSLDNAISSLTASGFDSDQIEALQGAKDKATEHNLKKYPSKEKQSK